MACSNPDPSRVLRNTRTLNAHRARMRGAAQASMPFILTPVFLNPAIYIPLFLRSARHLETWVVVAVCFGWLALMCASLAFGLYRSRKYLRDHPSSEC